jgi:hypothetical protein
VSFEEDLNFLKNHRKTQEATSMTIKINYGQVCEIVVYDLMAKYKACAKRNDEYKDAFAKVLSFYITDDEFNEMIK